MTKAGITYEHRIVVFLDFLGFKDHIDRSVGDPAHVQRIARAIQTVREFLGESSHSQSRQFSQFSDCVVVSYESSEPAAVFDLLMDIAMVQARLASMGFLVRGSVVAGDLHHTNEMVFGPALVEAHRRESKIAIYPRILVDDALVEVAMRHPAHHHSGKEELTYFQGFLVQCDDGENYIDYLSWNAVVLAIGEESEAYPDYLRAIARILTRGLQSNDDGVLAKMLWLRGRYLAALDAFFLPPQPPAVVAKFQDFYDDLATLPRFDAEAVEAEQLLSSASVSSGQAP